MLRALAVAFAALALISAPSPAQTDSAPDSQNTDSQNAGHSNSDSQGLNVQNPDLQSEDFTQPHPHANSAAGPSSALTDDEDSAAESELLQSINKSRELVGAPPLRMNENLRQAARIHARRIVSSERLEHQLSGEPSLLERIGLAGSASEAPNNDALKIDRAGENLAYASSAAVAHDALMRSPSHRDVLLDHGFNIVGVVAIWRNGLLYVVQDFAHEVPSYSAHESRKLIVHAIDGLRQQAGLPQLVQLTPPNLDEAACSLAGEDRPNARMLATAYNDQRYNEQQHGTRKIVTYTASHPDVLPKSALRLLGDPSLHQFAIGSCYARNTAYPTGMYWVAILLY
jgi:uncharacterized protein YkwD